MNNNNRFLTLLMVILGTFLSVIIAIALVIFILRFLSIIAINIPGFTDFYGYIMLIIPYGIFFTTYYFLRSKIALAASKISRIFGTIFFTLGFLTCIASLTIATINFIKIRNNIQLTFEEFSHYFLVIQLAFIFIITMTLGLGDAKEEDWLDKHNKTK
jgi:hypothetical protein